MNEEIKSSETRQPISDEELDEASGGLSVTLLPYDPSKKGRIEKMPHKSGKKPEVTLL